MRAGLQSVGFLLRAGPEHSHRKQVTIPHPFLSDAYVTTRLREAVARIRPSLYTTKHDRVIMSRVSLDERATWSSRLNRSRTCHYRTSSYGVPQISLQLKSEYFVVHRTQFSLSFPRACLSTDSGLRLMPRVRNPGAGLSRSGHHGEA